MALAQVQSRINARPGRTVRLPPDPLRANVGAMTNSLSAASRSRRLPFLEQHQPAAARRLKEIATDE